MPSRAACRTIVSDEISHLERDRGYEHRRAIAAALNVARSKGCPIPLPRRDNPEKGWGIVEEDEYEDAKRRAGPVFLDAAERRSITVDRAADLLRKPYTLQGGYIYYPPWWLGAVSRRKRFAKDVLEDLFRKGEMVLTRSGYKASREEDSRENSFGLGMRLENPDLGFKPNPTGGEWVAIALAVASVAVGAASLLLQKKQLDAQLKPPPPTPKPVGPHGVLTCPEGYTVNLVTGTCDPAAPSHTIAKLLAPGQRLALYGDSLVGGPAGSENPGGLYPLLSSRATSYGATFVGEGQKGSSIMDWAAETTGGALTPDDAAFDVVVISLGTNDAFFTAANLNENAFVEKVATFFRQKGATVVWILPPCLSPSQKVPSGAKNADVVRQALVAHADAGWFLLWDPGRIAMGPDGVHPTAAGYQTLSDRLFAFLTENLS